MGVEIEGRLGCFLVIDEDGSPSMCLTPENADKEASKMLLRLQKPFDDEPGRYELRVVWCFWDEQDRPTEELPVYHDIVGTVAFDKLEPPRGHIFKVLVAKGVWQKCEEYLLRMNCRSGAEVGARKPQL